MSHAVFRRTPFPPLFCQWTRPANILIFFCTVGIDPWLDLCYHSNNAPLRQWSDLHPELLIAGAGHHWDSYGIKDIAAEPQFIQQAHLWEIRTVKRWLAEFGSWKP